MRRARHYFEDDTTHSKLRISFQILVAQGTDTKLKQGTLVTCPIISWVASHTTTQKERIFTTIHRTPS